MEYSMEEKVFFSKRFPGQIVRTGSVYDFVVLVVIMIGVVYFIIGNQLPVALIFLALSFFSLVRMKMKSIHKSIRMCEQVIKQNVEITAKHKECVNHLLLVVGVLEKERQRIKFYYVLLAIFLLFLYIFRSRNPESLLVYINPLICIASLVTGMAVYDFRNFARYFSSILSRNMPKISLEWDELAATRIDLIPIWEFYWKKWKGIISFILVLSVVLIITFYLIRFPEVLLIIIPVLLLLLITLMLNDMKNIANTTLEVLCRYDDNVKSQLSFVYQEDIEKYDPSENLLKAFIKVFRDGFAESQKRSNAKIDEFIDRLKKKLSR